jgi:hypothetical protein
MTNPKPNADLLQQLSDAAREERARTLLDLIRVNTFDLELAAWFVSHVWRGASYIVGSGPGGVGKTTTMHSLLSFVPPHLSFSLALPDAIAPDGDAPCCVVSNELSDHPPPTYLWDQNLRDFMALSEQGHLLVANVHADDLDEVHDQLVQTNSVPESQFRAINIFVFVCLEGGNPAQGRIKDTTTRRVINKIFYSDGHHDHKSVYDPTTGLTGDAPRDPAHERLCRALLEELERDTGATLLQTRERFLAWSESQG